MRTKTTRDLQSLSGTRALELRDYGSGFFRKTVQVMSSHLRRLIQGVLRTDVLAFVDGQLAMLLASVVRLADALLVPASAASARASSLIATSMRL